MSFIHASASIILLWIPSSVLFIFVCLFFSSCGSLVNISWIFSIFASILFLRSWVIFTIIVLHSFPKICLSPLHLAVFFLGFYLVPSFGMVTSKYIYAKGDPPRQLLPVPPLLWWAPAEPCLHSRSSNTRRWFWFSFLWGHCSFAPFLWVLVHTRFCLCAGSPSLESLFPTDLWKFCNQILLGFKISVSGNSQTLSWVCRLGSLTWGSEPSQTVGELPWHYCSPVCVSPTRQVRDLILSWLCPSYHLTVASSLSLDLGYLFLVSSSILLSMIVQQLAVILVLSQEEMSTCPCTLPFSKDQPDDRKIPSISIILWLPKLQNFIKVIYCYSS